MSDKDIKKKSDRLGTCLPMRPFGRSGEWVTQMGVGGFHIGLVEEERTAQEIIETALREGVRFFDNAPSYLEGRAEHRYGKFLTPKYRDEVFMLTKTKASTAAEAEAEIDVSLARMNTDHLDVILMHAVLSPEDVDARLDAGVFDAFQQAREKGKVRYLGFSGHVSSAANLRVLERLGDQVDVSLMPINAVDASNDDSFIKNVLPKLNELGAAPLAMKTAAGGGFFSGGRDQAGVLSAELTMEDAFKFVLSQSVSCWVSGMEKPEQVRQNAAIARNFSELDPERSRRIVAAASIHSNNTEIERYRRWM